VGCVLASMKLNSDIEAMQQNSSILIAAAFTMIGFALGRVTAPDVHHGPKGLGHPAVHHMEWFGEGGSAEDIQIMVKSLESNGFEGDTVIVIPGGEVRMVKSGDEIEVEVEMDEAAGPQTGEHVVVKKQVIVTSEED